MVNILSFIFKILVAIVIVAIGEPVFVAIGVLIMVMATIILVWNIRHPAPFIMDSIPKNQTIIKEETHATDNAYIEQVLQYAASLGYSPSIYADVDEHMVTHVWLINSKILDVNSTDVFNEKMIEIPMISLNVKINSTEFNDFVKLTKGMIDVYHSSRKGK